MSPYFLSNQREGKEKKKSILGWNHEQLVG